MNKKPGMTLIEVLVVTTVIGTLVAMLLPAVQASRGSARRAACQNNLHQLGAAMHSHLEQHGRFPVDWAEEYLPFLELGGLRQTPLPQRRLLPVSILHCPSDTGATLSDGRQASSYGLNLYIAGLTLSAITDGLHCTAAFGEVASVPYDDWTCSREFTGVSENGPHGPGANVLFCDGHVGFIRTSDLSDDLNLRILLPDDGGVIPGAAIGE